MKPIYQTSVIANGGREGWAHCENGTFELKLSKPSEFGGDGSEGLNPEQLFAVGYAACFLTSLKHVAAEKNIEISNDVKVKSTLGVGKGDGGFDLDVVLHVSIPPLSSEDAKSLAEIAHGVCPYSRALTGAGAVKPRTEISNF